MSAGHRLIRAAGGWDAVSVVFDVGANDGADFHRLARAHPGVRFVAIEPTPALATALRQATASLPNYTVIQCAISTAERRTEFHVIESHNGGLNSLHTPRPYLFDNWAKDKVAESVRVDVRRLDSVARELGIAQIDVLHIDTQGSDLDVLRSAGPLLKTVKAGRVEVTHPARRLYEGTPAPDEVASFLWEANFAITTVLPNDALGAEKNLVFARKSPRCARLHRRLYPFRFRLATLIHPTIASAHVRRLRSRLAVRTRWRKLRDRLGAE